MPSKLPGCPEYLSKGETSSRLAPEQNKEHKEYESLRKVLAESLETASAYENEQAISSIEDLYLKFKDKVPKAWNMVRTKNYVRFIQIVESELENKCPLVGGVVSINSELYMTFCYHNFEVKNIILENEKIKFPLLINILNLLDESLEKVLTYCAKKRKSFG